jgi:hypothetical protein
MADEERNDAVQRVDPMEDPTLSWVGPEPRGTASVITPTALGVFGVLEEDPSEENLSRTLPSHGAEYARIWGRSSDALCTR